MEHSEENRPGARLLLKTIGAYVGAVAVAALSIGIDYLYIGRLTGRFGDFPTSGAFGAGTFATVALTVGTIKAFSGANKLRKLFNDSREPKPEPSNINGRLSL